MSSVSPEDLKTLVAQNHSKKIGGAGFHAEREIENCHRLGISLISRSDGGYPAALKVLPDAPPLLYIQGELIETDAYAVAIVGSRRASYYGLSQAARFARSLADCGLTIVSGMAMGVDQEAHRHALNAESGRTIGVLGCGLDIDYPQGSGDLRRRIARCGAVISEYPLGTLPLARNFPHRNRTIAGLSQGTLVIEANRRSGSLITARLALDYGRDVFALPGRADQASMQGNHQLIKEGAYLTDCPEDILSILKPVLARVREITPAESSIYGSNPAQLCEEPSVVSILRQGDLTYDEILQGTNLDGASLGTLLLALELQGKVRKGRDGRYRLE
ncbi:MAG: DNA-processing protein DprA [Candidatus Omnitrophota bacterium]|nr:DNA-processing protein DprA [Candidatus Omnitrophota bacterium]